MTWTGEGEVKGSGFTNLGLWQAEVGPDEHEPRTASPHKAGISPQVPRFRVHEEIFQCAANDARNVGDISGETDSLLAQSCGPDLRGQRPPELAGRQLEGEGPDEGQNALRPGNGLVAARPRLEDADQAQLSRHHRHADHVHGAAAEVGHQQEPIAEAGEEGQAIGSYTQVVGLVGVEADLLEEVRT